MIKFTREKPWLWGVWRTTEGPKPVYLGCLHITDGWTGDTCCDGFTAEEYLQLAHKLNELNQTDLTKAPWSIDVIAALKRRQADDTRHQYTCVCGENLYPTEDGWRCPKCPYEQNWCHEIDIKEYWE